jgi:hypothetical protein
MLGLGRRGRFERVGGRILCGRLCRLRCGGSRGVRGWRERGALVGGRNRRLWLCMSVIWSTNFRVESVTLSNDTRQISHLS